MKEIMSVNYILELIRSGQPPILPYNTHINKIDELVQKKSLKKMISDNFFLYIDSIRFTHINNRITEYNIDFFQLPKLKFPISLNKLEDKKICQKTMLHRMILILRHADIGFKLLNTKDIDYLILKTDSGVNIYFDLENGNLFRIGKMVKDLPIPRFKT